MIKRSATNRILSYVLENKLYPILFELGFKFQKSKMAFLLTGNEVDLYLRVFKNSSEIYVDDSGKLIIQSTLRSEPKLTKFDKWHKKTFNCKSRSLTNSIFKTLIFHTDISEFEFTENNFYEPTASQRFKAFVSQQLSNRGINSFPLNKLSLNELYSEIKESIIPIYQSIDNIDELIIHNRIPLRVKAKLLIYTGRKEEGKAKFLELYERISNEIEIEEMITRKRRYELDLSNIEKQYLIIFDEFIKK